jgi:hypothetical protein
MHEVQRLQQRYTVPVSTPSPLMPRRPHLTAG